MDFNSSQPPPHPHPDYPTRTPLSLFVKAFVTHAFALITYGYATRLLRRNSRSSIQALRFIFFAFVPTLPLVELLFTAPRALLQFIANYEDDDAINAWYYLCGALGMHATVESEDSEPKPNTAPLPPSTDSIAEEGLGGRNRGMGPLIPFTPFTTTKTASTQKPKPQTVLLLDVGAQSATATKWRLSLSWLGSLLALLFSLLQATGTIVIWARRVRSGHGDIALKFDHRNGAMAIASAICGLTMLIILLSRREWTVSKAFTPAKASKVQISADGVVETKEHDGELQRFFLQAYCSLCLYVFIAMLANEDNQWRYFSVGLFFFFIFNQGRFWLLFSTLPLIFFIRVFWADIPTRLGLREGGALYPYYRKIEPWVQKGQRLWKERRGTRRWRRIKVLVSTLLVLAVTADVLGRFVVDILIDMEDWQYANSAANPWVWQHWTEDPISEAIVVI